MSNMSYCRFQNTLSDLEDCQGVLEAMIDGVTEEGERLSRAELIAAKALVHRCLYIARLIAEQSDVAVDELDECEAIERTMDAIQDNASERAS